MDTSVHFVWLLHVIVSNYQIPEPQDHSDDTMDSFFNELVHRHIPYRDPCIIVCEQHDPRYAAVGMEKPELLLWRL
jgi:hypothetical protein